MRTMTWGSIAFGLALLLVAPPAAAQLKPTAKTHLGGKPDAFIELVAVVDAGSTVQMQVVGPDGSLGSVFAPPDRTALVITDVEMRSANAASFPGTYVGRIFNQGQPGVIGRIDLHFNTAQTWVRHVDLTSGVVFSNAPVVFAFGTNPTTTIVVAYGYLVKYR